METESAFDYLRQAELARKAQRELGDFRREELQKVRANPNRDTLHQWGKFQKAEAYRQLLEAFWDAFEAAYPPGFDDAYEKLHLHYDLQALEMAVTFLEADPYFFRSGYTKEKLLRDVRGYQLPVEYVARLQQVILKVVDSHYCREFCEYRKLAHKLDSRSLRAALEDRTHSEDAAVRNRAHWILDWLIGLNRAI